ncbi:MAG TPA: hypothetical protein VLS25_08940 [Dehalococcoidia bacterium]|nr:hypothetical protein [Dehalococcoidia bacterium]
MHHKNRLALGIGAVIAAALIGAAAFQVVSALQPSAADQTNPVVKEPDPCEGQTDEECNHTINGLRSEGATRYTAWVNDFIASGQDPRALPRSATTALPMPPVPGIDAAVADAEIIFVGTVATSLSRSYPLTTTRLDTHPSSE